MLKVSEDNNTDIANNKSLHDEFKDDVMIQNFDVNKRKYRTAIEETDKSRLVQSEVIESTTILNKEKLDEPKKYSLLMLTDESEEEDDEINLNTEMAENVDFKSLDMNSSTTDLPIKKYSKKPKEILASNAINVDKDESNVSLVDSGIDRNTIVVTREKDNKQKSYNLVTVTESSNDENDEDDEVNQITERTKNLYVESLHTYSSNTELPTKKYSKNLKEKLESDAKNNYESNGSLVNSEYDSNTSVVTRKKDSEQKKSSDDEDDKYDKDDDVNQITERTKNSPNLSNTESPTKQYTKNSKETLASDAKNLNGNKSNNFKFGYEIESTTTIMISENNNGQISHSLVTVNDDYGDKGNAVNISTEHTPNKKLQRTDTNQLITESPTKNCSKNYKDRLESVAKHLDKTPSNYFIDQSEIDNKTTLTSKNSKTQKNYDLVMVRVSEDSEENYDELNITEPTESIEFKMFDKKPTTTELSTKNDFKSFEEILVFDEKDIDKNNSDSLEIKSDKKMLNDDKLSKFNLTLEITTVGDKIRNKNHTDLDEDDTFFDGGLTTYNGSGLITPEIIKDGNDLQKAPDDDNDTPDKLLFLKSKLKENEEKEEHEEKDLWNEMKRKMGQKLKQKNKISTPKPNKVEPEEETSVKEKSNDAPTYNISFEEEVEMILRDIGIDNVNETESENYDEPGVDIVNSQNIKEENIEEIEDLVPIEKNHNEKQMKRKKEHERSKKCRLARKRVFLPNYFGGQKVPRLL